MMSIEVRPEKKRYLWLGVLLSVVVVLTVGCNNPTSSSSTDDDESDTVVDSSNTLTLSGEIQGWSDGTTETITVPNVGSETGDEGTVETDGTFSITVSDLEEAELILNAVQSFEDAYNSLDWEDNPLVGANTFIALFHDDLDGSPQFADGDVVFSISGAGKDEQVLRGFNSLRVNDSDLVRSGTADSKEVITHWLYSAKNVDIQAEAVLTLEEAAGDRTVDIVFVWETDFNHGWNPYHFFSRDDLDTATLDDLLSEDEIRFGYSNAIDEPANAVWEIQ
ncbi:MAG: hypothetical protein ACQETQ_12925 [Spirochaetota bacterium]